MADRTPQTPLGLFGTDALIDAEDRAIRDTVRAVLTAKVRPHIGEWFEWRASWPSSSARWACSACTCRATAAPGCRHGHYGLACLELEAGDSGIRSLVSVQGSLAMFAIWRFGSEEQKQEWLPRMAAGEAIGCFGLTEPDFGSNPAGMRTYARRDGTDWVLDGTKMWITNGSVADVAVVWAQTDEGHSRVRRAHRHAGLLGAGDQAQAVAACLGHLRAGPR
jgi:glutaryl-CoA dehydrogenase